MPWSTIASRKRSYAKKPYRKPKGTFAARPLASYRKPSYTVKASPKSLSRTPRSYTNRRWYRKYSRGTRRSYRKTYHHYGPRRRSKYSSYGASSTYDANKHLKFLPQTKSVKLVRHELIRMENLGSNMEDYGNTVWSRVSVNSLYEHTPFSKIPQGYDLLSKYYKRMYITGAKIEIVPCTNDIQTHTHTTVLANPWTSPPMILWGFATTRSLITLSRDVTSMPGAETIVLPQGGGSSSSATLNKWISCRTVSGLDPKEDPDQQVDADLVANPGTKVNYIFGFTGTGGESIGPIMADDSYDPLFMPHCSVRVTYYIHFYESVVDADQPLNMNEQMLDAYLNSHSADNLGIDSLTPVDAGEATSPPTGSIVL